MSFTGGPGWSSPALRVRPHAFGNRRPVLGQRGAAHQQTEVPAIDQLARYVPGRGRDQVGECPDLLWRCDVVLDAREQETRTIDGRQVHLPPVDNEQAASQFVVDEQVPDDPESCSAQFQQLEPGKLVLHALHTTTDTNRCPVEREFVAWGKQSSPFLDRGLAGMCVNGRPTYRERVHALGV